MTFVLIAFALVVSATFGLKVLNLRHLRAHGNRVPPELEGSIDADLLRRISAYTIATSRLGTVQSLVHSILVVAFLFGGVLGWYDGWIAARASSLVWSGLLFFVLLLVAESVLGIPFSLARNFGIENRYGFNTMGVRLWLTDLLKTLVLSTVFLAILVAGALLLVSWSPRWWWLWVWGFFLVFNFAVGNFFRGI
ncbi:MAG: M48 family peptidase, partial [Candidatus Krumholzibacteriia bacterium]